MGDPPAADNRDDGATDRAEATTARLAATGFPGFVVVVAVCFLVVGALWAVSRDAPSARNDPTPTLFPTPRATPVRRATPTPVRGRFVWPVTPLPTARGRFVWPVTPFPTARPSTPWVFRSVTPTPLLDPATNSTDGG